MLTNVPYSVKEIIEPALLSMMVIAKFSDTVFETAKLITTIHALQNPTIYVMPTLATLDQYKIVNLL